MKANLLCGKETISLELPDSAQLIENKPAKAIKETSELIRTDLDSVAIQILREDIASLAVVGRLCLNEALKHQDKTVNAKGHLHPAMTNYLKIQSQVKSGLLALKRFEQKKGRGLADLFENGE